MKKRFFVLVLCLAAALGIFAAAAETPQNVDAEVNKYIFYVNDASGSTAVFQSAVLEKGQSLSRPENPSPQAYGYDDHYRFAGWYANEALTTPYPDFDQEITDTSSEEPIAIYAKFEQVYYITYYNSATNGAVILTDGVAPGASYTFSADYPAFDTGLAGRNIAWQDAAGTQYDGAFVPTGDMSVYPVIQEGHYLRFDSQGGSAVVSRFIPVNEVTAEPDDPNRAGYWFDGWFDAAEGGNAFTFGETLTSNTVLYARWTPVDVNYTIAIWLEKSMYSGPEDKYEFGVAIHGKAKTGDVVGYDYDALTTDQKKEADEVIKISNGKYTRYIFEKADAPITVKGDGSSILNVYYRLKRFKVEFYHSNTPRTLYGTDYNKLGSASESSYSKVGETITVREGQRMIDAGPIPSEAFTWKDGFYPIFTNGSGTSCILNPVPFTGGGAFYLDIHSDAAGFQMADGITIKIANAPDTSGPNHYEGYHYGQSLAAAKNGETGINHRNAYTVLLQTDERNRVATSWDLYPTAKDGFTHNSSMTLKKAANGTVNKVNPKVTGQYVYYPGDTLYLYYDRESYTLDYRENGGPAATDYPSIFFEDLLDQYTANYNDNGTTKTYAVDNTTYISNGVTYIFKGWYDNEVLEGTPVVLTGNTMPAKNLILYAKWEPVQSTVKFNPNGGTLTADASVTLPTGSQVAQPTDPLWADDTHVFLGWTRDGYPYDFSSPVDQNFVLVAHWASSAAYTVTYDPGRGSGAQIIDSNQYLAGSAAVASAFPASMTPPGQEHFVYWQDVGGQAYLPGQTVPVNGNVTLTAVYQPWTENKFNITFNPNGGTLNGSANPVTTAHDYDEGITIREMPEREGYRFLGWDDGIKPEPYYQPNEAFTVKGHHTFIAKWIELMDLNGEKIWVDGGKSHDNSTEVQLTLTRRTVETGTEETVAAVPSWNDGAYAYTGLDKTDAAGNPYTYTVTETPVEGYDTTQDGYNITNTITEINRTTEITGTKTWVDGGKTHENENEVQLILTRISAKASSEAETVNVTPTWSGKTYTYADLPQYDAEGYVYTYTVAEKTMDGYDTVQIGNDFINTQVTPTPAPTRNPYQYKFSFTKKWQGDAEDSINWTFYNPDGTERSKKFDKKIISETEWYYEGWFVSEADYYLVEKAPAGYKVRYENVGKHAGETDRCYNGGTIINYKVPKTGDDATPALWIALAALGIGGLSLLLKKRRASAR